MVSLLATYWHPYCYCQAPCHYLPILKPALTKTFLALFLEKIGLIHVQLVVNVRENIHSFLYELRASGLFYPPVIVWL